MKTQVITRANLYEIYTKGKIASCSKWNKRVEEALSENKWNDSIEVPDIVIQEAYNEAGSVQKKLIKKYFVFPKSVIDKFDSIEDVWKFTGENPSTIIPYPGLVLTKRQKRLNASAVIDFVTEILNEGWIPDFSNPNQYKYYPYLEFKPSRGRWVWYYYYCLDSRSGGAVAYYKSEEIAKHAFKLLEDYYNEYLNYL